MRAATRRGRAASEIHVGIEILRVRDQLHIRTDAGVKFIQPRPTPELPKDFLFGVKRMAVATMKK